MSEKKANNNNQGIQVISRAVEILRLLGKETGGLSLGQIASRVNLPRSTVHRIVSALAAEGLVSTRGGNGAIRLGPEIHSLAKATINEMNDKLRPIMLYISKKTGETVDLSIFDGSKMLFIDQIVGSQRLRAVSSIGKSFPLTSTANGKAALACLENSVAEKLIRAELMNENGSNRSLSEIQCEIGKVKECGLALDDNEHTEGISALGIAIMDKNEDIYALSTPVPSIRFEKVREKLSEAIFQAISEFDLELKRN